MEKLAISIADVESAHTRMNAVLPITPLTHSPVLSEQLKREVFIKWDNKLVTGSFKERGAFNFLSLLSVEDRKRGVCAASAGNHALALSRHAARLKIPCVIVMPVFAPLIKIQSTEQAGATVFLKGQTFDEARDHAKELAQAKGLIFVPAFEHAWVMAGQGTCALEVMNQLNDFDSMIVPIGGGGYMAGVATAIKARRPEVFLLGVQSEWAVQARNAAQQLKGSQRYHRVSIADGIAVKQMGALTSKIIERLVDKVVSVSEEQVASAMIRYLEAEKSVMEGAGAAALAALLAGHLPEKYKRTVVVACGSNVDMNTLTAVITRDQVQRGRLMRIIVSVPDRPGSLHSLSGIIASVGGNVVHVHHDRLSTSLGLVDIMFVLEVRDRSHGEIVVKSLQEAGVEVRDQGVGERFTFDV